jgi:hypothetical protein
MLKKLILFIFLNLYLVHLEAFYFESLDLPLHLCERDEIPFIKCNEADQNKVIQKLSEYPLSNNGVHIGWSIEFNFKAILVRKPHLAIICDINKRVLEFLEVFEKVLLSSNSTIDCVENLKSALESQRDYFFNERSRKCGEALESFAEWLSEDSFQLLKKMVIEKRILYLCLNILDQEDRFLTLGTWLRANEYTIDTVYTSNISSWTNREEPFYSNLLKLIDKKTLFIDAHYDKEKKKFLALRITQGSLPWVVKNRINTQPSHLLQGSFMVLP